MDLQPQHAGGDHGEGLGGFAQVDRFAQMVARLPRFELGGDRAELFSEFRQLGLPSVILLATNATIAVTQPRKDSLYGVIVLLRDRIELVAVTSCATDREPQEHRSSGRYHLVQFVLSLLAGESFVGTLDGVTGSGDQKSRGGVFSDRIPGQLVEHETVVRSVLVEGSDHVVAVGPRVGDSRVRLVPGGFCESHHVQPVSGPAFSGTGTGQQPVDGPFPGGGSQVRQKAGGLRGGGWQTGDHQRRASQEPPPGGRLRELQSIGVETGDDEGVDRRADRVGCRCGDRRQRDGFQWPE